MSRKTIFSADPEVVSRSARAAYDQFRQGQKVPNLRREIRDSWGRSVAAGVNPDGQEPPRLHDLDVVRTLRERHRIAPFITMIGGFLEHVLQDESQVFVITDGQGEILWRFGSSKALRTADATGFKEGVGWSERDVGTNAIGVALTTRRPATVFSAEHYIEKQHEWVCMAAPVLDPESDETLAVLNLTGPFTRSSGEAMSFVQCAASLIQEKLRFERRELDVAARDALDRSAVSLAGQALLSPGGRFVHGDPQLIDLVAGGRRLDEVMFELASGHTLGGELLGDYLLVRSDDMPAPAPRAIELRFLGPHEPSVVVCGSRKTVTVRRAEILYLLATNRNGLSADEIAMRMYGDDGLAGTARSEMHRIRASMGSCIESNPYRFSEVTELAGDFLLVREHLRRGQLDEALDMYSGPLLPRASSLEVELARDELHDAVRRSLLTSKDVGLLRRWVNSDLGSSDEELVNALLARIPSASPEASILEARLAMLDRAYRL